MESCIDVDSTEMSSGKDLLGEGDANEELYSLVYQRDPLCSLKPKNAKQYRKRPKGSDFSSLRDSGIIFDSQFESGNLLEVYKKAEDEYILIVQNDTETTKYSDWYYFKVISKESKSVRLHVVNLYRPLAKESPLVQLGTNHWKRTAYDVAFSETNLTDKQFIDCFKGYFTLSFTYDSIANEPTYFAKAFPYTYSQLSSYIKRLKQSSSGILKSQILTQTLCRNPCEYITITDNKFSNNKKAIILTSRVHPGETHSSYIIQGLLNYLLSKDREAELLRKHYVFYVIPMLNPDGVIHGNSRCSTSGSDLNRQWTLPSEKLHPTIFHAKELIKMVSELYEIAMFCDLHGHSKKQNVFLYGCHKNPKNTMHSGILIPSFMAQSNPFFDYSQCHFRLEKSKESTARITIHREFNVKYSYTIECSMSGVDTAQNYFSIEDLEHIGRDLSRSCLTLCSVHSVKLSMQNANLFLKTLRKRAKKPAGDDPKVLGIKSASFEKIPHIQKNKRETIRKLKKPTTYSVCDEPTTSSYRKAVIVPIKIAEPPLSLNLVPVLITAPTTRPLTHKKKSRFLEFYSTRLSQPSKETKFPQLKLNR